MPDIIARFFNVFRVKRVSLRYKIIFLFTLAIMLPALLLSVVLTSISRQALSRSIFNQQQEIVNRLADRIYFQLSRHRQLLLSHRDLGRIQNQQQLMQALRYVIAQGSSFSEISILDHNAREVVKYRRDGPSKDLYRRTTAWRRWGWYYISDVQLSGDRNPYMLISVPLENNKRGWAALMAKLELDSVWDWIAEIKIGDNGQAFLVNNRGLLIAHRERERVWAHTSFDNLPIVKDYLEKRMPSPDRWHEYKDERGERVTALYREIKLSTLQWAVVSQIPVREVYAPVREMLASIALWTIVWTAVFLVVGLRFVNKITNPLELLQSETQRISQGKLDTKLDIRTGDEIQELAENFQKMAEDLKALEELKQDLTRMIIHDLKSPLSGIMGSLDYLNSGMLGEFSADQKKIIGLAKNSSMTMLSMIQNLLDIAKMEEGKLELTREKVDLTAMLTERQHQFGPLTVNERKTIVLELEPGVPPIDLDRNLVERVLNNLIANALHHTSSGGEIRLRLRRIPGAVEVTVADNGVGIPPEYREKIFEKFVQVKRKQASLRTGAGLGLTFCKMAVVSHGGTIHVESELNKGSSFICTFPVQGV